MSKSKVKKTIGIAVCVEVVLRKGAEEVENKK